VNSVVKGTVQREKGSIQSGKLEKSQTILTYGNAAILLSDTYFSRETTNSFKVNCTFYLDPDPLAQ
jgi:hypothetical protein